MKTHLTGRHYYMRRLLLLMIAMMTIVIQGKAETPTVANWQFTASWYFGILPDYEIIQPIRLMDTDGNDVTAQCLSGVTFTSGNEDAVTVRQVPEGHNSGMTGYWMLKAGQNKGNASITGTYSGNTQWGQAASATFTVFCGDPTDPSWQQNNMFGIDPIMVYANKDDVFGMPTITVNGSRNALTDFDITEVRSSNPNNVRVIEPKYNNAGVLVHGYQFEVLNATATRVWIEIKGKGPFQGYWAKIYFNVNGYTVKKDDADSSDPNADVIVGPMTGEEDTPVPTTATYSVKIPVPNYVLAAGQTIHQTPSVMKAEKNGDAITTTNVTDKYTFIYSCDRPDYAYVAKDGTVTALKEIKEPVYINVKATPTDAGVAAGCKETSTSYSVQIYSSESVIRLNPTALTIPMASATEGEKRLVPSIIMKVNGVVYEPNQGNTYNLTYEGFDPSIVTLVDKDGKVQGIDNDFSMVNVMYFKALKAGTTQGIVHAKGRGQNSGFWGTAPFSITVTPYAAPADPDAPAATGIREISIPVPFYTMAYGNTIHQRIKVKEFASAEDKKNNIYTDVTDQYTLTYTSSNDQIATVDEDGVVTAVADNVNPAYIKVTATPKTSGTATVNPSSFGVKVFGGASVISLSHRNISLAPNELVPLPEVFVIIDGVKYSSENAFNLHYEVTDPATAVVVSNEKLRGVAVGSTTATVKIVGKGDFEGFYATAQFDITVRVSETLDGSNTWYWAQDGARSSIYNLYPGKQLHFEFENKSKDINDNTGWVFVASKTPGYSDQAFLAANPVQNYITWDGWGTNANPQPEVSLNGGTYNRATFESDLKNAHIDYVVALDADGKTLSINATIQAKNEQNEAVRTYTYTIENKQLSYEVNVLPVYFSSVRSTIETLRLVPQQYTATVAVEGVGGTAKILVGGIEQKNDDQSYKSSVTVDEGSHVVFMAMPKGYDQAGGSVGRYYFVEWKEDNSTNITRDFYIDHNISLTATFRAEEKKWLEVTTDGQDYLLNEDNYGNDFFFKIKYGEEVHYPEMKWDNIPLLQQTLTPLYAHEVDGVNDHHIDLYVRGAKAFRVYAYDGNGTESNYTVKVDNGEAKTVNHHGTALETSQIFKIDNPVAVNAEGTGYNTITLAANDNQLYPFIVQFFTKNIITQTDNRQYVTLADDCPMIVEDALATAGTLSSVTYSNQSDKEIATVEVDKDGKLVVTGHKAGNILVKLNFDGGDDYSDASFDYTIIVKKRDVRISWNKKAVNVRAGGDQSINARLSYYEIGLEGDTLNLRNTNTPPYGIEVNYISTDTELLTWDWGVQLGSKLGSADLIARIDETDQVMAAMAVITINVSDLLSGPSYDVGEDSELISNPDDGKKYDMENNEKVVASFDLHVYKYNDKLVGTEGKELKDIWGEVKEYQGSDAMKKVWYIDGFSFNTQGNQNAMNELFRGSKEEYNIRFETTSGEDAYKRVHPFSLPVRGSFVKFEAIKTGVLTAYVLQNGNFNFNHISEYENKKNKPISDNPRLYYWFDQEGNNLQSQVTATTHQPLAIGRRDDLPELTEALRKQTEADPEIAGIYQNFQSQWDVDRNMEKEVPEAQPIIEYHGGYTVMNKAYVKYELPVKAGNTYYFFSNDSKVAFAGVTYQTGEPASARRALQEEVEEVPTTLTLSETDDNWGENGNMQKYLGKTFEEITLTRKFIKNKWNTICLPFNVSEKQVEDVFGVGSHLIIYNGITNVNGQNIAQFLRHVDQNILAGQPYFIYSTGVDKEGDDLSSVQDGAIQSLTFTNVTIPADLQLRSYGKDDEDGLRMAGTLSKTDVAKYDYYVNANTGAITRYTGAGTKLNAYRAFLQQTHPAQGRSFNFGFTDIEAEADGAVTGLEQVIQDLGVTTNIHQGIYTLDGRRAGNNIHGIQIIDGKKIIK